MTRRQWWRISAHIGKGWEGKTLLLAAEAAGAMLWVDVYTETRHRCVRYLEAALIDALAPCENTQNHPPSGAVPCAHRRPLEIAFPRLYEIESWGGAIEHVRAQRLKSVQGRVARLSDRDYESFLVWLRRHHQERARERAG